MNAKKKLSVITVCYNASDIIERTIQSVISQDQSLFEYIIIDGKSTDATINICQQYSQYLSIYSEKDNGIFDAMNKGVNIANGEWIIFMNAGDVFYDKDVLSSIFYQNIPNDIGFIFGDTYLNKSKKQKMTSFVFSKKKLTSMGICHQSIFVRTELAKNKLFDLNYKVAADYNMIRTIYKEGWGYLYTNNPVSIFDTNGYSSHNRITQFEEVAKICKQNDTLIYFLQMIFLKIKLALKQLINYRK